jgi:phosphoribosylformimino-5-aminoimidazole carboxamide ribotide isomerase
MRIITAIDILGGKCVRLTQGDYSSKIIYNEDPLEVAKEFEDNGLKYLHLVDLDGAKKKMIINYHVLDRIASKTSLTIDFGGGIRSENDLKIAFSSGARQVTAGSIAVSSPSLFLEWLGRYTSDRIILGADCITRKIATNGWTEKSEMDVLDFMADYASKGVEYSVCTDVDKDGLMMGPSTELYKEILKAVRINLIASGGISSIKDIEDVKATGCEGTIIGKAIYEGKIKLKELRKIC